MTKQLRRTVGNERKVAGVCGGIAKYFNLDPTLIRIAFVLLTLFAPGIILYIVCCFVMPEETGLIEGEFEVKHNCAPKDDNEMKSDGTGKNGWN